MQKQKIILIAGVVLAIISVFMVKAYLDEQRQIIEEKAKKAVARIQTNQAAVLVAKQNIPKGTSMESDMFKPAVIPNQYLQPQAVTSADRITGMVTIAPIEKGEQITLSKLSQASRISEGGLAGATPVGKRAVTISVDNVAALAGMIKPGDNVDVIITIPMLEGTADGKQVAQDTVASLFQNVLVLAVGQQTGIIPAGPEAGRYKKQRKGEEAVSPLITLALSPQEANLIAFVQEQGKIKLTLRSPTDSAVEPIQTVNWVTLFQYLAPKHEPESASGEPEPEPEAEIEDITQEGEIEIYRGLKKEKIPLSR
ncbi:MAG: Flp pilus assembly protein CpaB [Candidatus Omnitrophota bacterium]|nr:Flp pilus assembly protein CpaB [Candidatus Omnitrophota bacterium]